MFRLDSSPTSTRAPSPRSARSTTNSGSTANVLDLMASWVSHFTTPPQGLHLLGMNKAELDANPMAATSVVHDLNADPSLPFAAETFDDAVCCVSIDYLVRPIDVVRDVARVRCAPVDASCARSPIAASRPRRYEVGSRTATRLEVRSWLNTSASRERGRRPSSSDAHRSATEAIRCSPSGPCGPEGVETPR